MAVKVMNITYIAIMNINVLKTTCIMNIIMLKSIIILYIKKLKFVIFIGIYILKFIIIMIIDLFYWLQTGIWWFVYNSGCCIQN